MDWLTDIFRRWLGLGTFLLLAASPFLSRGESIVTLCTQEELQARVDEASEGDGIGLFDCGCVIILTNSILLTNSIYIEIDPDDGSEIEVDAGLINEITLDGTGRFITLSGSTSLEATNGVRIFLVDSGVTLALTNIALANGISTNG